MKETLSGIFFFIYIILVWLMSHSFTCSGVYDLYCSQLSDGDLNVLASLFRTCVAHGFQVAFRTCIVMQLLRCFEWF